MTLDEFRRTLAYPAPPASLSGPLAALRRAENDEWDVAHALAHPCRSRPARDFMHTCVVSKASSRTPPAGIAAPESPFATVHSTRSEGKSPGRRCPTRCSITARHGFGIDTERIEGVECWRPATGATDKFQVLTEEAKDESR